MNQYDAFDIGARLFDLDLAHLAENSSNHSESAFSSN